MRERTTWQREQAEPIYWEVYTVEHQERRHNAYPVSTIPGPEVTHGTSVTLDLLTMKLFPFWNMLHANAYTPVPYFRNSQKDSALRALIPQYFLKDSKLQYLVKQCLSVPSNSRAVEYPSTSGFVKNHRKSTTAMRCKVRFIYVIIEECKSLRCVKLRNNRNKISRNGTLAQRVELDSKVLCFWKVYFSKFFKIW